MNFVLVYMVLGYNYYYLEEYDKVLGYFWKGFNLFFSWLEWDVVYFYFFIVEMYIRLDKFNSVIMYLDFVLLIIKGNSKVEYLEILKIKGVKVILFIYFGRFEEVGMLLESCFVGVNF